MSNLDDESGHERVIRALADAESFVSWDSPIDVSTRAQPYRFASERAARCGADESIVTGEARIGGRRVALVVSEFAYLGGSIGRDAAGRVAAAFRRATSEGIAVVASVASGGTRMQEGTAAFLEMIVITRAVVAHREAGLLYLVHLRHPATGGVLASWGSRGHLTFAEPEALVGFFGPKIYRAVTGEPFPAGVQTAEHLVKVGVIDRVVPLERLRPEVATVLAALGAPAASASLRADALARERDAVVAVDAWESVARTRREDRPGVRELIARADEVAELSGTGRGERDPGIIVGIVRMQGHSFVLIGQDRRAQAVAPLGPGALRHALRGMEIASALRLPVVTVIDTPGAEMSPRGEEGALAGEIARCLATLVALPVPTVTVLLGEGTGGGAIALAAGERVIAAADAWLAPLAPEGASVIVHGDVAHADDLARRQGITADALRSGGFVDVLVPAPSDVGGAEFVDAVLRAVADALAAGPREAQRLVQPPSTAST